MRVHIEFDTDNAAFHETPESFTEETARILRELAERIWSGKVQDTPATIRDINGNVIGEFRLEA